MIPGFMPHADDFTGIHEVADVPVEKGQELAPISCNTTRGDSTLRINTRICVHYTRTSRSIAASDTERLARKSEGWGAVAYPGQGPPELRRFRSVRARDSEVGRANTGSRLVWAQTDGVTGAVPEEQDAAAVASCSTRSRSTFAAAHEPGRTAAALYATRAGRTKEKKRKTCDNATASRPCDGRSISGIAGVEGHAEEATPRSPRSSPRAADTLCIRASASQCALSPGCSFPCFACLPSYSVYV